jgi:hypothetical protein
VTRDEVTALLDAAMREAVKQREERRLAAEREAYVDEILTDDKDTDS